MPRDNSSKSRSRSPKRGRRYDKDSSESDRANRRKPKYDRPDKESSKKHKYDIEAKSDIKNHFRYDNIPITGRRDEQEIMTYFQSALKKNFGIDHLTKIESTKNDFSLAVGFKYDRQALQFLKQNETLVIKGNDKLEIAAKPTPVFEQCIEMIKQAKKEQKQRRSKARSYSHSKRRNHNSHSSQKNHKKKKQRERSREDSSRRRSHSRGGEYKKRSDQKQVWIFGLPWSVKGKEAITYLQKHSSGPFHVSHWKWIRVKETNCQFMLVTLDYKKAQKLLSLRQQHSIEGCPCIITNSHNSQTEDAVKDCLKQYQFRISFPEKINPASLYKALNQSSRVVQIVSCNRLVDGRSDTYTVTLGNASKARDVRRLNLRESGIRVEENRGQLVYRPTKHSKLTDNE